MRGVVGGKKKEERNNNKKRRRRRRRRRRRKNCNPQEEMGYGYNDELTDGDDRPWESKQNRNTTTTTTIGRVEGRRRRIRRTRHEIRYAGKGCE